MPDTTKSGRRGKGVFFTLDFDAIALLAAMVPHSKARGSFCSELIRKEAERRAARPQLLETLVSMNSEAGRD
jgi:hypothetical protein